MTSLTTLLLQAAISLLLLVQGNPNVDPALREQAIAVAKQAIKTATAQSGSVSGPSVIPLPATNDRLFIDPPYAELKVGESQSMRAVFIPRRPACLDLNQPCEVAERAPYEVQASFISNNPFIVAVDETNDKSCDPPRMCPVATNRYAVRGVSLGQTTITASYVDSVGTYTAKMNATVAVLPVAETECAKNPASSQNFCWQMAAQQKGDVSLCRNIVVPNVFFSKDSCTNAVAQVKKDSSLCASITEASIKKGCISSITSGQLFPWPRPWTR